MEHVAQGTAAQMTKRSRPDPEITITLRLSELVAAHSDYLFPMKASAHLGSAHCLCPIAKALRAADGHPEPGTPEYAAMYERATIARG